MTDLLPSQLQPPPSPTDRSLPQKSLFRNKHVVLLLISISILGTLSMLLAVQIKNQQTIESRAAQTDQSNKPNEPEVVPAEPQFLSNEILVKVKKEAKGKVKGGNPNDTGIAAIDELGKEKKIKKFEKIAKEGKKSKTDADIFQWYKLELDEEGYIIKGSFPGGVESIQSDHPKAGGITHLIARFKNDPSIEAVEPNFIVTTTQEVDIKPTAVPSSTPTQTPIPEPTAPPSGVDLVITDLTRTASQYASTYCNYGTATSSATFTVQYKNKTTGKTFESNYLYPYDVPQPGQCVLSGGIGCALIDDLDCTQNTSVEAMVDFRNAVLEINEENNVYTEDFAFIPTPTVNPGVVPNDPYFGSKGSWGQTYDDLYGLKKLRMADAWKDSTGSSSIVVASIDTGVDRNHEDIAGNMWVNADEIPGNGIDDDGNRYIDDYYGWDFYNNDNDPMDDHGHGTHTAGTIAAVGNNGIGVVGVNWTGNIMALKFIGGGGFGTITGAGQALQYAADNGARVSNNSYGCACQSTFQDDMVRYEHDRGMVVSVSAGNSNADALDQSPASSDGAITVAASDYNDVRAGFSNTGEKLDVAAPGVSTLSLKSAVSPMCTSTRTVGTSYCYVSGTSMASPHVVGLAALLLSKDPTLTNEEIRQLLRIGAVDLGTSGKDPLFGYGRIDAASAMQQISNKPLAPIITSPGSRRYLGGTGPFPIVGSVPGPNFSRYTVEVGSGRQPTSWIQIAESTTQVINGTLATVGYSQLSEGINSIRLNAYDASGQRYQFQVHDILVDIFDVELITPLNYAPVGTVEIYGDAAVKNGFALSHYMVEWGVGTAPSTFSSEKVTLSNSGTLLVRDNLLATWDTRDLVHSQLYTIRLTVHATNGLSQSAMIQVTLDNTLVSGWPKRIHTNTMTANVIMPVMDDIDADGTQEIIYGDPAYGKIIAVHKDGTIVPGFPASVDPGYSVRMPVTVSDIDGDGKKEIIAPMWQNNTSYRIYHKFIVIRYDGVKYPGWTMPANILCDGYNECVPTIADITLDGKKDIVFLDRDGLLHAWQLDGSEPAGFPKKVMEDTSIGAGVAIDDLDNDGVPEIAAARFRWVSGFPGTVYLFDNNGNLLAGWPFVSPPDANGSTVKFDNTIGIGDIDGDGTKEFYTIGTYTQPMCNMCQFVLYGWKKDGTVVSGFPQSIGRVDNGAPYSGPELADADGDGNDELILATNGLKLYDEHGLVLSEPTTSSYMSSGAVAVGDIDGDGKLEYGTYGGEPWPVTYGSGVFLLDDNGAILWSRPFTNQSKIRFEAPIALGDMDGNGAVEYAAVRAQNAYSDMQYGYVYLWEIPGGGIARDRWTMVGYEAKRTNKTTVKGSGFGPTATPVPPTPTPTPIDSVPPTVRITYPPPSSRVRRGTTVTITADATDNVAVSRVVFFVNGIQRCNDTTAPYSCPWDVPTTRNTMYVLNVVAYDPSNNNASHGINVTAR